MYKKLLVFFNLTPSDVTSIFRGFVVALIGAGLTYLTGYISGHDFGQWTPMIVTFWGVLANTIRKSIDTPVKNLTGTQI